MTIGNVPAYDADRASVIGDRAVVVGGSVAGLCAAGALADWFERVVVLERDEFPTEPTIRDGAPQTGQPHALLEAGRRALEGLFPGFSDAVRSAGGLWLDTGTAIDWYDHGGVVADPDPEFRQFYASRPLFEHVVREQVRAIPEIRLRGGCHLLDYEYDADAGRVTGVAFRDDTGDPAAVEADLVVDATGRTSRTPAWLADRGYPTPPVDRVEVDVTYSTVRIERPPDERHGVLIAPEVDRPRGAGMLPVEDGRWEVILQGVHGERAPADRETFVRWTESLPVDGIARQVRTREWRSEPRRYPFPESLRRRYEDLDRFPDGLAVTGDAVASFNPIYGQGMSVAAMDALALHAALSGGIEGVGPRTFDAAGGVIDEVWRIAVGNDFAFEATTGPKPAGTDLFNRYVARLLRRAQDDGRLTEAFFRVFRLERPATSLLRPGVLRRVFRPRPSAGDDGEERAADGEPTSASAD